MIDKKTLNAYVSEQIKDMVENDSDDLVLDKNMVDGLYVILFFNSDGDLNIDIAETEDDYDNAKIIDGGVEEIDYDNIDDLVERVTDNIYNTIIKKR